MRSRKKIILFTGAALLIPAVSVSAFAEVSVLYQAISSKVAVHLEEFMQENGEEVPWEDEQTVLPGGILSKIPRICNDGESCYVRAAVEFESSDPPGSPLTVDQLVGVDGDWVYAGDYFYYKNVLPSGETVDFFQGIQIPEAWESGVDDDRKWKAEVTVDAVQAEFFEPDFSSEDPWGMQEKEYKIQEAAEEVPGEKKPDQQNAQIPVALEIDRQLKGFSVDSREFFRELEPFLPGESQTGILKISNRSKQEREVYIRSEALEENEFLKELELTIQIRNKKQNQTRIIYQGKLSAEEMREYQSLGKIRAKESETAEFLIRLPEEADNRYSVKNGSIKFWFTTDLPERQPEIKSVKTGDAYRWSILREMLFSVVCLGICMAVFFRKCRSVSGREKR